MDSSGMLKVALRFLYCSALEKLRNLNEERVMMAKIKQKTICSLCLHTSCVSVYMCQREGHLTGKKQLKHIVLYKAF